jgi:uncharacterized protein YaiI (UPF0178 family)
LGSLNGSPRIFVDADACPVKPEVYRVALRHDLEVRLVANVWMRTPAEGKVTLEVVKEGFDGADDRIVEEIGPEDLLVTADIPLAGRAIRKGARVLGTTGRPFTDDNIGHTLATRNLLAELRESGVVTGGPKPITQRDRSRFLHALDEMVRKALREGEPVRSRPLPSPPGGKE